MTLLQVFQKRRQGEFGFVAVLLDPAGATPAARWAADVNGDGSANGVDVGAFLTCLISGGCS